MSKQISRIAVPIREVEFKAALKKIFPEVTVEFEYSPIVHKYELRKDLKNEGCFGYYKRESILVNGMPIKISWLPHVKDMPASYFELILVRVEKAIREVLVERTDDGSVDRNSNSTSRGVG